MGLQNEKSPRKAGWCKYAMDYIEFKLWMLGIGMGVVFFAHLVYKVLTGRSLEELADRDRQARE